MQKVHQTAQKSGKPCDFPLFISIWTNLDVDDLQITRLEETEALADVDIYLRVAARADDEFTLFLRVERVLLGEVCLDGVCLLERGVDEVHFGIALVEVLFHDGIVRAAEDQVFDLFARENVVDLRTDFGVNVVLVEVAAVNECREQGRALADDLALGITLMDELGVLAGGNSELRRDEDARAGRIWQLLPRC
jgi:hypothetical protein